MCERDKVTEWARATLDRRRFGALGVVGAVSACAAGDSLPRTGQPIAGRQVRFESPDGMIDGEFFAANGTSKPGVIFWPDIAGIRPAKRMMAQRLAEAGYAVLLANPYYRDVAGQQFADFADFAANGGWDKVTPWRSRFNVATITRDQAACARWLRGQHEVDGARGIGTQGYCMTGGFALVGPSAHAAIRAGASFHAAGLVVPEGPSAHRTLRKGAHYLVAIARNDDAKAPAEKDTLKRAAAEAGVTAEITVYPADHGWCVPDSPSYDAAEAERAWTRLLALYSAAL